MAFPVETVPREPEEACLARLMRLAEEYAAVEYVIGLPLNLRGEYTPSTDDAVRIARALESGGLNVRMLDERLTTVTAQHQLQRAGKKTKRQRPIIDQAAAVLILQQALDQERRSGLAPGIAVPHDQD